MEYNNMARKGRYGKRKQVARRRFQRRRVMRKMLRPVHHFKEVYRLPDIVVGAATTTNGVLTTDLGSLGNWSSFRNLFDLYKITGVKFKFLYRGNSSDVGIPASGIPTLYTAPNRDPSAPAPVGIGDILNDDGIKVHRCDGLVGKGGIYIKSPKPDMTSEVRDGEGGLVGKAIQQWNLGVGNSKQYWLTTGGNGQTLDQSQVPHYGLRYIFDNQVNSISQSLEVYATLYFSMKEQD